MWQVTPGRAARPLSGSWAGLVPARDPLGVVARSGPVCMLFAPAGGEPQTKTFNTKS